MTDKSSDGIYEFHHSPNKIQRPVSGDTSKASLFQTGARSEAVASALWYTTKIDEGWYHSDSHIVLGNG